jgi:chaperonin cofactor prefoldin
MPKPVEECVQSVLEENPDYTESRAYAVCHAEQNKGNLSVGDDPSHNELLVALAESEVECPEGKVSVGDKCVEVTEVEGVPPSALDMSSPRVLSNRELRGKIEREELEDGSVVYRNMKILTEGIWTDANSQEPIHYIPENLKLVDDNTVNLIHDTDNEVSEVGRMENESTEDGAKFVDLVLHRNNSASEYADENLQKALETNGEKGFGGPSVEIPAEGQEITPDGPQGVPAIAKGIIDGLGLVGNQADKNVSFAKQTQNRAVALSADSPNAKVYTRQNGGMSDAKTLADTETIREVLEGNGIDTDEMTDGEVKAIGEELMDEYGMDEEEPEDMENEGGEGDEPEEDEPEEDTEMQDGAIDSLEEQIDDIWGKIEELEAEMMGEEMEENLEAAEAKLSDATETIESLEADKKELQESLEEQDKRLSELENEPEDPKTLSDSEPDWEPEFETTLGESSEW